MLRTRPQAFQILDLVPGGNRAMTEPCPRMLSPEDLLCHRQRQHQQNLPLSESSDSKD